LGGEEEVWPVVSTETEKYLVPPVCGCDGLHRMLTVYCSVRLF